MNIFQGHFAFKIRIRYTVESLFMGTPPFRGHKLWSWKNVHIIIVSVMSIEGTYKHNCKTYLCLIFFTSKDSHAIPLFVDSNVLPVDLLYIHNVSKLMFDVVSKSAPDNILQLFDSTSNVHSYQTRSSTNNNFYIHFSKTNLLKIMERNSTTLKRS